MMKTTREKSVSEAPDVVGMTLQELEHYLTGLGKEKYRAVQIMKWIHQGLVESFSSMTNLSMNLRQELSERAVDSLP